MKTFVLSTRCPKCDHYAKPANVEYKVGVFNIATQEGAFTGSIGAKKIDEYMLRTCVRCRYKWPEKPLDAYKGE